MKTILFFSAFLTFSCSFTAPVLAASNNSVVFASYNVENLFDTQHDEGKKDWEFLPMSFKQSSKEQKSYCKTLTGFNKESCFNLDWSQKALEGKLAHVADTILSINEGQGPDLIMLPEVENINVLHQLNANYLQKAGYQTEVLLEGWDDRGIDVGFLSKFPIVGTPVLHPIEFSQASNPSGQQIATRGILEVKVKLPTGEVLTVFGVHLPSQAHPNSWREDAIATINKLVAGVNPTDMVLVGGDFNISRDEEASTGIYRNVLSKDWGVSHIVGCKACKGTEVFHDNWQFLDAHLYSQSMMNGQAPYQVDIASINVFNGGKYQLLRDGTPARYKYGSDLGVSDHLPMVTTLVHK